MDRLLPGVVLAFAGGIAAARGLPPLAVPPVLAAFAAALFAASRVRVLRRRLPPPWDARASPSLLVLAALLGAARAGVDGLPPGPRSLERLLPGRSEPVLLEGTALSAPEAFARAGTGGHGAARGSARFEMEAVLLRGPGGLFPVEGRVEAFVEGDPPAFLPGDGLRIAGLARPALPARNPGARDRAAAARGRGIDRIVEVPGPGAVAVTSRGGFPSPSRAGAVLRGALLGAIGRAFRGPGAALYEALLAGRKDALDPGLVRDFRRTGTWHVLVVSGIHIALAAGAAALLLARCGAGPVARAAGTTLAAAAYTAASGFGVPSLRSLTAVALLALSPLARRRADPVHSLFLAAGLLTAVRPAALEDPGFQLSFAAVLGILRLSPALGDLLFARRRFLRRFPVPAADRSLRRRLGDLLERGLPPSLAAWAATAPILAHHFGTVNPLTPLANLLVVPAATAILAAGALLLPVGIVLPALAAPVADALAALLGILVRTLASLPGAWLPVPPPGAALLAADAALLAAAALRPTPRRLLGAAGGLAALSLVPLALPPRPEAPSLLVLDAGHGLAVLADAGTAKVLYDAGGRGPRVAADAILPALRARGAGALDALVLSHEDADHFSAAGEVLEAVPVGRLVVNGTFGAGEAARGVLALAAREGVPVVRASAGDRLRWPGIALEILQPPRGLTPWPPDNDGSLVVRVRMEGLAALLPGDLEGPGVRRLLLSGADLRADALVLPHHGSPGVDGLPALAAAVRARVVVASAGPSTIRVDRLASPLAPRFLCTADVGAVLVTAADAGPVP